MNEQKYIDEMVKLLILQKDLTWKFIQLGVIKDFYSMQRKIDIEFDRKVKQNNK